MYSLDFRKHVLKVGKEEDLSIRQLAARFKIGFRSIVNWRNKLEPSYTRNKTATSIDMEALKEDIKHYPDAYVYERAKRLNASPSGIAWALRRLKVTRKKPFSPQSQSRKTVYVLPKH